MVNCPEISPEHLSDISVEVLLNIPWNVLVDFNQAIGMKFRCVLSNNNTRATWNENQSFPVVLHHI